MSRVSRTLRTGAGFAAALSSMHCVVTEPVYIEEPRACTPGDSSELFERRIAPLLDPDKLTTCNQCHLSGVDLGLYAQGDACATMACMVESGIVDLAAPDDSLVLDWILRADPASDLIDDDVIEAEHSAMREWIEFNARCGGTVCAPVENPCDKKPVETCELPSSGSGAPRKPFDDPGDCSDLTLEEGFAALVYPWRGRCYPCHFDSYTDGAADAPRWLVDGPCDVGAARTLRQVIDDGLLDPNDPSQSLLLLKPLAESVGGVMHGGHDKFATMDDPAYLDFLQWIERWAECRASG